MDPILPRLERETRRRRRAPMFRHQRVPVRMLVPNFFTLPGAVRGPHLDPHVHRRALRAGAGRHRVRGAARRHRRPRGAPLEGVLTLRRRARQPRRLRQFRRGPGVPDLHLGPRRSEKPRLDLRDDLRARLGAATGALQRGDRRGQAEMADRLSSAACRPRPRRSSCCCRSISSTWASARSARRRSCSTSCWSTRWSSPS